MHATGHMGTSSQPTCLSGIIRICPACTTPCTILEDPGSALQVSRHICYHLPVQPPVTSMSVWLCSRMNGSALTLSVYPLGILCRWQFLSCVIAVAPCQHMALKLFMSWQCACSQVCEQPTCKQSLACSDCNCTAQHSVPGLFEVLGMTAPDVVLQV